MGIAVVMLAAGQSRRMKAGRPKVLLEVAGAPLVWHALKTVESLRPERIVAVVRPDGSAVREAIMNFGINADFAIQEEQFGTAHAVGTASDHLGDFDGDILVLYADTPFVSTTSLLSLIEARKAGASVAVLGFMSETPEGYGRLVRSETGLLSRIVEDKDASPEEKGINLCNSGVVCAEKSVLFDLIDSVGSDNSSGEYYLTDIIGIANSIGLRCSVAECLEEEAIGINTLQELAKAEAVFQSKARKRAMAAGASLVAPDTVHFSFDTRIGQDVKVEPYVVFGPGVEIETQAVVKSFSHLEGCTVGAGAAVGPFARIRPNTVIGESARIGNFVEVKASSVGQGSKALHLAYIGNAEIGIQSNIGAGSITCNYDGFSKHQTKIGDRALIGSNTMLVAPVEAGNDSMTAAGSVITCDVPENALAVARGRQVNKPKFAAKLKERRLQQNVGKS